MYHEPRVTIVAIEQTQHAIQCVIHVTHVPPPPLAPASLHAVHAPHELVVEFHAVLAHTQHDITFETYRVPPTLPALGQSYILRTWWTDEQLAVVTDTARHWVRAAYPNTGDHDHCVLTWERIAADTDQWEGYQSEGEWITIDAYNTYIRDDLLRLRQ